MSGATDGSPAVDAGGKGGAVEPADAPREPPSISNSAPPPPPPPPSPLPQPLPRSKSTPKGDVSPPLPSRSTISGVAQGSEKMFASAEEEARAHGFVSLKLEGPSGLRVGLGEMLARKGPAEPEPAEDKGPAGPVTPQQLDAARATAGPAVERLSQGLPKGSDLSAAEAAAVYALASLARRAETEGLGALRIADALALQYEERQRLAELQEARSSHRSAGQELPSLAEMDRVLEEQEMRVRKREVDATLRMSAAAETARVQGSAPLENRRSSHSEPGKRHQFRPGDASGSLMVDGLMFEELKILAPPNTQPVDLGAFLAAKHKQKEDRAKENIASYERREAAEAAAAVGGGGAAASPPEMRLSRHEEFQRVKADLRLPSTVPPAYASLEAPEAGVRRSGGGKTMVSKTEELLALKAELRVSAAALASQSAQASTAQPSASLDDLLPPEEAPPSGAEPGANPSSNPEVAASSAAPRRADASSAGPPTERKEPRQPRPSLLSTEEARELAQIKRELQLSWAQLAGKTVVSKPPRPTELLWTEDLTVARVTPQAPPPPLTAEERYELSAIKADLEASAAAFAADAKLFDAIAARSRGAPPNPPPTVKPGLSAEEREELAALKLELRRSAASLARVDLSKRTPKALPDMMPYTSLLGERKGVPLGVASANVSKLERNNSAEMIRPPTVSTAGSSHGSLAASPVMVHLPPSGALRRPPMPRRRMTKEFINPELLSQTKEEKAAADAKQLAEAVAKGAMRRLVATTLVVVAGEPASTAAGMGTASAGGPSAAAPVAQWGGESHVRVRVDAAALAGGGAGAAVELHVAPGPSAADPAGSNQSASVSHATRVAAPSGGARVRFTVRAAPRSSVAPSAEERVGLSAEEREVLDRLKAELRKSASELDGRKSVPQWVREAPSWNFTTRDKAAAAAKREAKWDKEEERERKRTAEKERRRLKKGAQKAERKRRKASVGEGSEDLEGVKAELRAAASALAGCRVVLTATPRQRDDTVDGAELTPPGGPPKVPLTLEELEAARLDLAAVKEDLRASAKALLRFRIQRRSSSLLGEYVTKMELDALRTHATTAVSKLAAGLPLTEEDEHKVRALVRAANSAHVGGVAPTIADRIASKWVDRQALDALVNKAKLGGTLSVDEMDEMLEEQSRRAKARELEAARKASAADQRVADYANHKNSMSMPAKRRVFAGRKPGRPVSSATVPAVAAGSLRRMDDKPKEPSEGEPAGESGKKKASRSSRGRKGRREVEEEEEAPKGPTMADTRLRKGDSHGQGAFRGMAEFLKTAVGEEEEGEEDEEDKAMEEGAVNSFAEGGESRDPSLWDLTRDSIHAHVKEELLQRAMAMSEQESAVFRAMRQKGQAEEEMPIDNPTMRAAMRAKVLPTSPRMKEKYKMFEDALPAVEESSEDGSEAGRNIGRASGSGRRGLRWGFAEEEERETVAESEKLATLQLLSQMHALVSGVTEEERAAEEEPASPAWERWSRGVSRQASRDVGTRICREAYTQTEGEEWPAPREPVSRAVTAEEEEARVAEVARHAAEAAAALQREAAREAVREEAVCRAEAAERRLQEAEAAAAQRLAAEAKLDAKLDAERARLEASSSRLAEERHEMLAADKARVAEDKARMAAEDAAARRAAEEKAAQESVHAAEREVLAEASRAAEAERHRMELERQQHEFERQQHGEEKRRLAWENEKLKQEMASRALAEENAALRRELEAARDAGHEAIEELARQLGLNTKPELSPGWRGAALEGLESGVPLPQLGSPGPVAPRGPVHAWGEDEWEAAPPLGSHIGRLSHAGLLRAAHAAAQEELLPGRGVHADPSWRGSPTASRLHKAPTWSNAYEQRGGRVGASRSARGLRPDAHLELGAPPRRAATADGAALPRLHGASPAAPSPGSPRGVGASLAEGPQPSRPEPERRPARGGVVTRGQPPEYAADYDRGGSSLFVLEQGAGLRALPRQALGGRPGHEVPLPPAAPRNVASPRRVERGAGFPETPPGRPYEGLQGSLQRAYAA